MTAIITSVGSSIIGSLATKTFDSLVTSKYTSNNDKKKWLREKTLILFSELSSEVQTITPDNLAEKQLTIRQLVSRIILLVEDKTLQNSLENYSFIINEYIHFKDEINLENINNELFNTLKLYIKKI